MILKVLSYYDRKLGVYTHPIYVQNEPDTDVIEKFRRMLANPEAKIPESYKDFEVYCLGTFDDSYANFDLFDKPGYLLSMSDFIKSEVKSDGAVS